MDRTTTTLPPLHFPIPQTTEELLTSSGSSAGYHAVSSYLGCPEKSRLKASGLRRKKREFDLDPGMAAPLDALGFGLLIHALLGTRLIYGQAVAERMVARRDREYEPNGLSVPLNLLEEDRAKAMLMLRTYDATHPLAADPWKVLGVETEVVANVGTDVEPCYRTARLDGVVQIDDSVRGKVVFSLEHKTAARSGNMKEYTGQAMVQATLWNRCPKLVEQYGPMVGVIFDVIVKTGIPKCERLPPRYISKLQMDRAMEYLRLPDRIKFPILQDGAYPRMLHECWGRYGACEYVDLCIEGARGEYENINKPATGEEGT